MDMDKALDFPEEWKNKRFHYAWVTDDKKMQTVARLKGYETVKASDIDSKPFMVNNDPRAVSVDNLIRVGDVILMRCPKDKVDERRAELRRKNQATVRNIKEDFHSQAASLGVASFEEDTK